MLPLEQQELGFFSDAALRAKAYSVSDSSDAKRMHQNEVTTPTTEQLKELAAVCQSALLSTRTINTYPNLTSVALNQALQDLFQVDAKCIEVTAGSSQAIALLALGCFAPGKQVAILQPSFSVYEHYAQLYNCKTVTIPLNAQFRLHHEALFHPQVLNSDVVILCSPNNPTGGAIDSQLIRDFHKKLKHNSLLVLDEAYIEFAPELQSLAHYATQHKNMVVLRTLSKAWGLAGLRVGALVTHPTTCGVFRAIKPPYSLSFISEALATYAITHGKSSMRERVKVTRAEVDKVEKSLQQLNGVEVFPSVTNFICFRHERVALFERLLREQHNILVRVFGSAGPLANVCRANMWDPKTNQLFINLAKVFFER